MKKLLKLLISSLSVLVADSTYNINSISIYGAQGVDANLRELPRDILTFGLPTEDTYLYGLSTFILFKQYENIQFGFTPAIVKHVGLQSHLEIDGAVTLKYTEVFTRNDYINVDLALGIGLSYAFGTPRYEDPIINNEGVEEYYKFQSFLHFDAEIYTPRFDSVHLLLRIHHRSGIYGLIAPPKVGSNFIGVGVVLYLDK